MSKSLLTGTLIINSFSYILPTDYTPTKASKMPPGTASDCEHSQMKMILTSTNGLFAFHWVSYHLLTEGSGVWPVDCIMLSSKVNASIHNVVTFPPIFGKLH